MRERALVQALTLFLLLQVMPMESGADWFVYETCSAFVVFIHSFACLWTNIKGKESLLFGLLIFYENQQTMGSCT